MSRSRFFQKGVQLISAVAKGSSTPWAPQGSISFDSVFAKQIELQTFTKGHCVCSMVIGEEHINQQGNLHGSFTAGLVDIVTTLAIVGVSGKAGTNTDLSISYLKPARKGEEITVDAKCLKVGKYLAFTTADVTLADGTLIAQGKHTKFFKQIDNPIVFPMDDEVD